MSKHTERVEVLKILGKQPSLGLINANQVIPCLVIFLISYTLTNGFFSLGMPTFLVLNMWGIVSWLILTGNKPHLFIDRFRPNPGYEWCNGYLKYLSPIPENRPDYLRAKIKDTKTRINLPTVVKPMQSGKKRTFMPFQNHLDVVSIFTVEKNGQSISGYLLNKGQQYQVVFGFVCEGLHDILSSEEIENSLSDLWGLKELTKAEKMTIHLSKFSASTERQSQLDELANNCELSPLKILVKNDKQRVSELTRAGSRQVWQQLIFCTWTVDENLVERQTDLIGKILRSGSRAIKKIWSFLTGNEQIYRERFYKQLLNKALLKGYVPWSILLKTKLNLPVTPMSSDQLWSWIYRKFNGQEVSVPPIPVHWVMRETETEVRFDEIVRGDKDLRTVLIEGNCGQSACPQHRGSGANVWLPRRNQIVAVLTMDEQPEGWNSLAEQLLWMWSVMKDCQVRDTEAIVEISAASNFLIRDSLSRIAKQAASAKKRAFVSGNGRDPGAEVNAEESLEAAKKLYKGAVAINAAVVFCVYRTTIEELRYDCSQLSSSFGSARVMREENIAWALWLESMPITTSWLLHSSSLLSERRLVFDNYTLPGVLPLVMPRNVDKKGLELLANGGKPIYLDLFDPKPKRAFILGESGSGKGVLAWAIIVQALAENIPVVGMDLGVGKSHTFKTAVELLGDAGAYYDLATSNNNLLELPDLRCFDKSERDLRMRFWKDSVLNALSTIVIGKLNDPRLTQRVDSILLKTLTNFLCDPDLVERYNLALSRGWKSSSWQDMPTLKDFLKFCTLQQLGLQNYEPIDVAAINQIHTEINALLISPFGSAVGKPSSFSNTPKFKFFSFSGVSNPKEQELMALVVYGAALRNALSYQRSLFVGDELSGLLRKQGFAERVAEIVSIGRKNGIAVLLISQDIDSVCNCPARASILQNITYWLVGTLTSDGAKSLSKYLDFNRQVISGNVNHDNNASDAAVANDFSSKWLVKSKGRYWQTRFYPALMLLCSLVNDTLETSARERVMQQYPNTVRGMMYALKQFTDEYVLAKQQGLPLTTIGMNKLIKQSANKKIVAGKINNH